MSSHPAQWAWWDHSKQQRASTALSRDYGAIARLAILAGVRSGDGPLGVRTRPSALRRDSDRRAIRQRWKLPGECTCAVMPDPGDLGAQGPARPSAPSYPATAMLI